MLLLARRVEDLPYEVFDLYDFVTDMENYKKWFPDVVDIQSINELPIDMVGKRYAEKLNLNGDEQRLTIQVVEALRGVSFQTEGNLEPLLPMMRMEFSAGQQEKECQFSLSYFSRNTEIQRHSDRVESIQSELNRKIKLAFCNLRELAVNKTEIHH